MAKNEEEIEKLLDGIDFKNLTTEEISLRGDLLNFTPLFSNSDDEYHREQVLTLYFQYQNQISKWRR